MKFIPLSSLRIFNMKQATQFVEYWIIWVFLLFSTIWLMLFCFSGKCLQSDMPFLWFAAEGTWYVLWWLLTYVLFSLGACQASSQTHFVYKLFIYMFLIIL